MKTNRKVMLTLDEELYFKLKREADKNHVPLATYIKLHLVKLMKED